MVLFISILLSVSKKMTLVGIVMMWLMSANNFIQASDNNEVNNIATKNNYDDEDGSYNHGGCMNVPESPLFEFDECCSPSNAKCGNTDFCMGVMASFESSLLNYCCDSYESCQQTKDFLKTVNTIKMLSIIDAIVSTFALLCVFARASLLKGWIQLRDDDDNDDADERNRIQYRKLTKVLIAFEVLTLLVSTTIVCYAYLSESLEFAQNLIDAQCYRAAGDESAIYDVLNQFETFRYVAIAEMVLDLALISTHSLELKQSETEVLQDWKLAGSLIGDTVEVVLSFINLFMLLLPAISSLYAVVQSMDEQGVVGHQTCMYTCCYSQYIGKYPLFHTNKNRKCFITQNVLT